MSITRGDMRTKIQRRIGDTSFYTTALYNDIIDSRVRTWAGKIALLAPNYYIEHVNFTGVDDADDSDNQYYSFPAGYRSFIRLERRFGSGLGVVYQNVPVVNAEDQDRYHVSSYTLLALPDSLTNYEQTVSVRDTQFRLIPAPVNNNYLYRLVYLRSPVDAAADNTNLDIPDEWQEVIILDCAIYVLSTLGDSTVEGIKQLLTNEYKMLRDEYRRKTMDVKGTEGLS